MHSYWFQAIALALIGVPFTIMGVFNDDLAAMALGVFALLSACAICASILSAGRNIDQ